eukprot:447945-Rhodomonas_salina.1
MSGTDIAHGPTQRPVLISRMVLCQVPAMPRQPTQDPSITYRLAAYASAMRCPVLTCRMALPGAI